MATKVPKYVYDSLVSDAYQMFREAQHSIRDNFRKNIADAEREALSKIDLSKHLKAEIKIGGPRHNYNDDCCGSQVRVVAIAKVTNKSKLTKAMSKAVTKLEEEMESKQMRLSRTYATWKLNLYNQLVEGAPIAMPDFSAIVNE
jgi:hypothetical protein